MKRHEIRELLLKLKRKVRNNEFYALARGKGKTPAEPLIIKFVVANLTVDDFNKKELDHNGSGEFIFVFITKNGHAFYIKFKFVVEKGIELVKFISFHHSKH
ncbi:hypothetical protein [Streptococcus hyointestinalis]|uniref:hypothetical protein n=1 Tax=Streptococcus hyointestinalis TaxID=1337 RepID=UPI003D08A2AC